MSEPSDDEGPCTDCWGTGITIQTERRCACQPPLPKSQMNDPTHDDALVEKVARARLVWIYPRSKADMPKKPGKERYEYVECLVLRKGDLLCRPWNCEHEVFDDEAQDDFFCEWDEVTAYAELSAARAALAQEPSNG